MIAVALLQRLAVRIGRSDFIRISLCGQRWYRKWYGGRWENHFIEPCASYLWLEMKPPRCWPEYRQPCSMGTPTIEDWPLPKIAEK